MARLHTDLHYIPSDMVPLVLQILIDNGYITKSIKDVRYKDIRDTIDQFPRVGGAIIEITKFY